MGTSRNTRDVRTRRAIIERLKECGAQDASTLASELGVSSMAVRQHLYSLADEALVESEEQPRPKGRPAKMWSLTPAADRFFPDGHADLTLSLIQSITKAFGQKGLRTLLGERARAQTAQYRREIPRSASLRRRVNALARIRTREGYMARVERNPDGTLLLTENHCPICEAAAECQGLCAMELDVFQRVLGPKVDVQRTDHIQAGARRCAYRICPKE